jgi:tripartite-type tricarboxylate transporter receptor subunit TctC
MPNAQQVGKVLGALVVAACLSGAGAGFAAAQTYPARDITFVVAFAPGGVADTVARLVGQGLGAKLGRTVVVENRGGAGGNIAAAAVARANADGYTLLVTTTALAINETLRTNKGFAATDFKTVAIVASSPESLVTSASNPARNLAEFLTAAKTDTINYGTAGVGSGSHIAAEYFFSKIAHIKAQHIPFQGGAPAMNATIGNQIDLLATTLGGGADRRRQAERSWRCQRQARQRRAERADLCRSGLPEIRGLVMGWHLCAGQDRSGDRRQAE